MFRREHEAFYSFLARPLQVDPRPPSIPRPTHDLSDSACDDAQTRSNVPLNHAGHGVRVHGQWNGRKDYGTGSSERHEVGSEPREPYFVHLLRNGNRSRTKAWQQYPTDVSLHHFRQGHHCSGQTKSSYVRRNNYGYKLRKLNKNRQTR